MVAKPSERFMPEDPNTWQYRVWRLVDSSYFEFFIMILITLNTLILMMKVSDTLTGLYSGVRIPFGDRVALKGKLNGKTNLVLFESIGMVD